MPYLNPKSKKFQQIPYMPFVDYKTGQVYNESTDTQDYWMPLSEVIDRYMEHPESKLEGDIGTLQRRHISIDKKSITHIGKESNELEESMLIGVNEENYSQYHNLNQIISNLNIEEARQAGISKRNLCYLRDKIRAGNKIKLQKPTIDKLKNICSNRGE